MPTVWQCIFWVEIPLVGISVFYWLFFGNHYLTNVIGVVKAGPPERFLLALYAGVTGTMVCAYYAFLLAVVEPTDLTFLVYQVVLLAGDVFIVICSLIYAAMTRFRVDLDGTEKINWGLIAQIVMAFVWGAARVGFLAAEWP